MLLPSVSTRLQSLLGYIAEIVCFCVFLLRLLSLHLQIGHLTTCVLRS